MHVDIVASRMALLALQASSQGLHKRLLKWSGDEEVSAKDKAVIVALLGTFQGSLKNLREAVEALR